MNWFKKKAIVKTVDETPSGPNALQRHYPLGSVFEHCKVEMTVTSHSLNPLCLYCDYRTEGGAIESRRFSGTFLYNMVAMKIKEKEDDGK